MMPKFRLSYQRAFLILLLLHIIFFSPVLFQGSVIYHHSNFQAVTGQLDTIDPYRSHPKFSDQSSVYIPEIAQLLNKQTKNWLSTWNPYVQLGRPLYHISGFSRAFLLTHILSFGIQNPFRLYTALVVITVALTGAFFFSYLKTLSRSPIACLVASSGLSLGTYMTYWSSFVMFLAPICWGCGLLWITTEFYREPSWKKGLGISFFSYSLLLTGYPQFIVLIGYTVAINLVAQIWHYPLSWQQRSVRFVSIGIIGLTGAIAASPVYLDLIVAAQRSARLSVSNDFFLKVLPDLSTIHESLRFMSAISDPFLFGNPLALSYPLSFYNGISLSPLYTGLLLITTVSLTESLTKWRRLLHWYILIFACFLGTVFPGIYLLAVQHLGFNLSRFLPLTGAIIPAFILSAYAVDILLKKEEASTKIKPKITLILLISIGVLFLLIGWIVNTQNDPSIDINFLILSAIFLVGLIFVNQFQASWLLVLLTALNVFTYSFQLTMYRPLESIFVNSPLIEMVHRYTADGSRYAFMGTKPVRTLLAPNQEALLGLRSIHSYDSLSSLQYQRAVAQWSDTGTSVYGRYFSSLDNPEKLKADSFQQSGVSLLLSSNRLNLDGFQIVDEVSNIKFYQREQPPVLKRQTLDFQEVISGEVRSSLSPLQDASLEVIEAKDDYLKIKVASEAQRSLLFLSQQYHPQWQVTDDRSNLLQPVKINDFYQGVIIPPNTQSVELRFKPFVLWSLLPQVLYSFLGMLLLLPVFKQLRKSMSKGRRVLTRRDRTSS